MNPNISFLRLLLFIVPAYGLWGGVGLSLALPSGFASPIFPAAGLALVCALWFGQRALPGIWLGAAMVNLAHAWCRGSLTPATTAMPVVIAVGATLQAWVGCTLVIRRQGGAWRELKSEADAFRFLLFGGGLACTLSATVSVAGLYVTGVIPRAELLHTWLNWYVGDTLGVLVFAPLALSLFNRKDLLWRERHGRIGIPMVITLILTLLAFFSAINWERTQLKQQLRSDGEIIAKRITDRLITHREVLASLQHFIEATPRVPFRQFEQFTRITLADNPDIFALSFSDLVTTEQRSAYERMMSGLSPLGPFQITERDIRKQLVRAADRPEYVSVRYIVPLLKNRPAVGFDINSEPIRHAAIQRARSLDGMAVTAPVTLIQEQKQRVGVLELAPVKSVPDNFTEKPHLLGFAVAVVKVDELVEIATRGKIPAGLWFQVSDNQAAEGQGFLYCSESGDLTTLSSSPASLWATGLRMGDRDWKLSVFTMPQYQLQHRSWMSWAVGVVGLLFITMLQSFLLGMTGRTFEIQSQHRALEAISAEIGEQNRALKISEERYQRLFNGNPLPMWLSDVDTRRFLMVNDRAVGHYRWSEETFLGMTLFDLAPPGDGPAVTTREGTMECRHLRQDGSIIDVLVRTTLVEYGGREVCLEAVQDISLEKRTHEELVRKDQALMQSEKMASIGQLAAGVAHEINNPMCFISGNLRVLAKYYDQMARFDRLLLEKWLPAIAQKPREDIVKSRESLEIRHVIEDGTDLIRESLEGAERVTRIVRDLKVFSRVDAPEQESVQLNSCLDSALNICSNELKYVAVIRKEYEPGPEVICHAGQLNQVFLNLLTNAGQAITPPGEIVLRCWHDDSSVYASVKDSGQGIPESIRDRIFEPFFTTKDVGKGTGLGLSVSSEIIKKHHGEILVESETGRGTTFTVKLPRIPGELS